MHASLPDRVALAVALSTVFASAALAGGGGHGGGGVFHPGNGVHGGLGGHGGWGGGGWGGGAGRAGPRGLPPVAGMIHERPGMRPYFSAYGHTDTAARFGGFARGGVPAYGHTATALPHGGFRPYDAGNGHVGTGLRYEAQRRYEALGGARRDFAERRRYGGFGGGGFGGGFGGDGDFGGGTYGAPGIYGDTGVYGGQGTYGNQGTYGRAGTYGGAGTYATQSVYGNGGGPAYRSETPLAARFAEPPLGPSPFAPYSPGDRYAYAASEDVGPGPRVLDGYRGARSDCACGGAGQPVLYRYGIGTAY